MLPRPYVRIAVVVFLVLTTLGPFSLLYVPSVVLAPGDGAATTANLVAHEGLFRGGLLAELGIALVELPMTIALFLLFRPVHEGWAWLAALARGAMAGLQGVGLIPGLAALFVAADPGAAALDPALRETLVLTLFDMKGSTMLAWQGFFGVHCVALGVLIARSTFVPRWLGPLMGLTGLAYLAMATVPVVLPDAPSSVESVTAVLAMGELPFFLWLLIRGVDTARWQESAAAPASATMAA